MAGCLLAVIRAMTNAVIACYPLNGCPKDRSFEASLVATRCPSRTVGAPGPVDLLGGVHRPWWDRCVKWAAGAKIERSTESLAPHPTFVWGASDPVYSVPTAPGPASSRAAGLRILQEPNRATRQG